MDARRLAGSPRLGSSVTGANPQDMPLSPQTRGPGAGKEGPALPTAQGKPSDPLPMPGGLWMCREPGQTVTVGLTQEFQAQVGRVTRFRGPTPGSFHRQGESLVSLESEKWVGHFSNPIDGTVLEVNEAWYRDPSALGSCPWREAWLYRLLPLESSTARSGGPLSEGGPPGV